MLPLKIVETGAALTWSFHTIPATNLDKAAPIMTVQIVSSFCSASEVRTSGHTPAP